MSSTVNYTFYLESEPGVPAVAQSPEIVLIKKISTGLPVELQGYQIENLGDGLYKFVIDWDLFGNNESLFIKINTKLEALDQKYITMRAERHDYLPNLVDTVQDSVVALQTSADELNLVAAFLKTVQEGHQVIDDTTLYIYDKATGSNDRQPQNALLTFSLHDNEGDATATDIYKKINLEGN